MISAFLIFVLFLISLESLLSLTMCITLTVHSFNVSQEDPAINGNTMSWTLLTFAVVTPLSASIGMAFTRRESKLQLNCINLFLFRHSRCVLVPTQQVCLVLGTNFS